MKKINYILSMMLATSIWMGCSEKFDEEMGDQVKFNVDLTLPVVDAHQMTRALGDPGITEYFERPRHIYLFLALGEPNAPSKNDVYFYSIPCNQSDWKRSSDSLVFQGTFTQTVNWNREIKLNSQLKVRAYMAASFDELTTVQTVQTDSYHKVLTSELSKEDKLLGLEFYASGTNGYGFSLRDVYSTPYNLSSSWSKLPNPSEDRTNYYGTVTNIVSLGTGGIISMSDTLYHTAAKVDFQWNATDPVQENVMVNAVIKNAPSQGYLFKPAQTVSAGTYSKVLLRGGSVSASDMNNSHAARYSDAQEVNAGNQWNGRAYTYVLQPGDLNYSLTTSLGGNTSHTAYISESNGITHNNGTTNDIFAAWYKLDFQIKDKQ